MSWQARGMGILAGAAMAAVLSGPAAAYYHFTYYARSSSPFIPIQAKFDLNALPNKTVTFYVSDNGPTRLAANDSLPSVLGVFQQAIATWNSVGTSDLRLAFGGLYSQGAASSTPHVEIVFSEDVPPGVIDVGGPVTRLAPAFGPNGQFVPIALSQILVPRNLSLIASQIGASSNEEFFANVVHEVGHTLGLQHTWTSSAMSTNFTRSTSRFRAIDADDVAGLTLLYPKPGALAQFGSITGSVHSGGQPVHLASVVALRPSGSAVSTLTQPDGTYTIGGLPPDTYWVYVHPLPPAQQAGLGPGDIVLPTDLNTLRQVQSSSATETLFYPGTRDPNAFQPIQVGRGAVVTLNDINVQSKSATPIHSVSLYTYFGSVPVEPAVVNSTQQVSQVVPVGTGLISGNSVTPGLNVQVLGGSLSIYNISTYGPAGNTNLVLNMTPSLVPGTGPRHLYFTLPNDAYVLPSALTVVQKQPPTITSVSPQADGSVVVAGGLFAADSKVYFDSLPATTRSFAGNDATGILTVVPPVGSSGQVAAVTVYNSDGQNSTFLQPNPPTFSYAISAPPSFNVNPPVSALPAGSSAMVDITGINTNFVSGQTTVGVGSSDITVQRVWVLGPSHLWANVSVASSAAPGAYAATVITGFQTAELPFTFQVAGGFGPASINRPGISLPLVTPSGQTTVSPGATVSIFGSNLSVSGSAAGVTLTLSGQPVTIQSASQGQITFTVPAGMPLGPALLNLNNGATDAFPIVVDIASPPPVIAAVLSSSGQAIDATHPDNAGDIIAIVLQNLDPATASNPSRVHLTEGSIDLPALAVTPFPGGGGLMQAQFALSPAVTSQQVQVVVTQDGVASNAVTIAVR